MEEKDLVEGNIGSVGKYDVKFAEGKLVVEASAAIAVGDVGVSIKIGAKQVLEALKKAVPGTVDDVAFDLIEKALGL